MAMFVELIESVRSVFEGGEPGRIGARTKWTAALGRGPRGEKAIRTKPVKQATHRATRRQVKRELQRGEDPSPRLRTSGYGVG